MGHAGIDYGFVSWAGCLPEQGDVVVVLTNGQGDAGPGMALPLASTLRGLTRRSISLISAWTPPSR